MKRRSLTFGIAIVFLTWNVLTYLLVARGPPAKSVVYSDEVQDRLQELQHRLKEQVQVHKELLQQLQEVRQEVQQNILRDNEEQLVGEDEEKEKVVGARTADNKEKPADDFDPNTVPLPVLVIACNRPTIRRNLDQLLKFRPSAERFPIIVSQDCNHKATADVIRSYGDKVTLIQHPDQSDIILPFKEKKFQGYYKIARHYKWALQQVFHHFNHKAVVIVEDDLDVSPDFFEYFASTYPILHADPSLWCVSAWNDNGKASMVADEPELLYRTDFFPGLGWMLEKTTWLELEDKWPITFWDDWMRHPDQRRERACIRPEISRTSTFGKIGVSRGQYYEKHLKFIRLNSKFVPFTKYDLSYLMKDKYDQEFVKYVYGLPLLTLNQAVSGALPEHKIVRVSYTDKQSYKLQAKRLGIMDDFKSGVPRAAYRGVVSIMLSGRRIYFAPPATWKGYDVKWN